MSDQISDGGTAFQFGQISELTGQPINGYFSAGMSLRDWFAGRALQGFASESGRYDSAGAAADAYAWADAMIAARKGGAK